MNTTPEQLELAADILRHNRPWQYQPFQRQDWKNGQSTTGLLDCLKQGYTIQIKPANFPPKPDSCEWHNPDGLTAEQVGEGWRLCVVSEKMLEGYEYWNSFLSVSMWKTGGIFSGECVPEFNSSCSVRLPLSTPYPDGSYVKDGKLVKPWTLSRHIEGFRPLREGEEWMANEGWREDMFFPVCQQPARPLLKGEEYDPDVCCTHDSNHITTCRPLPEPPKSIPLGPEDVPPGSVFRLAAIQQGFRTVAIVNGVGIGLPFHESSEDSGVDWFDWEQLVSTYEILRPGQTNWQPCYREE